MINVAVLVLCYWVANPSVYKHSEQFIDWPCLQLLEFTHRQKAILLSAVYLLCACASLFHKLLPYNDITVYTYICGLANLCGVQAKHACSVIVLNTTLSEGSKGCNSTLHALQN